MKPLPKAIDGKVKEGWSLGLRFWDSSYGIGSLIGETPTGQTRNASLKTLRQGGGKGGYQHNQNDRIL
jgi:hypothetical protein